ncbi:MAG: glycosyltransferase [Candidatus Marinimicrobia bacterium]|nr:glycosyltransferase [Candidatus Neomarinimicrobiota bacterium]
MSKLSLCMIVKNEEHRLDECLKSVAGLADQIVIVDTGSTDRTIDIAKKHRAEVHHFQWNDDFSEARNEAIKYARADWILWLDADERFNPDDRKKMLAIISHKARKPEIYKINIRNYQKGNYYYISDAHRLFSNHFGIQFSGRIHEQISPSCFQLGGEEKATDIEIFHYGYNLNEDDLKKKNARNRKLLEKMVGEHPDYAYGYYTLAQNYALEKKYTEAVKYFDKALHLKQLDNNLTSSLLATYAESLIALEKYDEAKNLITESLQIVKMQTGAYYLLYKIAEKTGSQEEVENSLLQLWEVNNQVKQTGKKNSTDVIISEEKILETLAFFYQKSGQKEKHLDICKRILVINSENKIANRFMLSISIERKEHESAFSCLTKIADYFKPEDEKYLETLALIFLKNGHYEKSIFTYNLLLKLNPDNEDALKKLVGLLAKTGKRTEAENLLILYQQKMKEKNHEN